MHSSHHVEKAVLRKYKSRCRFCLINCCEQRKHMKTLSRVLSVMFILNAVMIAVAHAIQGMYQAHLYPENMLGLALSLCLLGTGFLQWVRPSAALLVLIVALFPFCTIIINAFMLPVWPLFRILPKEVLIGGLIGSNIAAVATSLIVWIGTRKSSQLGTAGYRR